MAKKRVFTSFDFDHDEDLRNLLVGQSKHPDSPFEMADWSVKDAMSGNWQDKVRTKIRSSEIVVVICGEYTHTANGVSVELKIAREENKPYFLLWGRSGKTCTKETLINPVFLLTPTTSDCTPAISDPICSLSEQFVPFQAHVSRYVSSFSLSE